MSEIPRLETERLVLRTPHIDDWPEYQRLMTSQRAQYMDGPYDDAGAWACFCQEIGKWPLVGFGGLMIDRQDNGRCLGSVAINVGPRDPEPELGWMLYEGGEGQGYAFEAAVAMRDWGLGTGKLASLVSNIDPPNTRSRRLAERMGATLDPDAARLNPETLVYRHPV